MSKVQNRLVMLVALTALAGIANTASAAILLASGNLTLLRVHNVGQGYGPPQDFIDGEVIVQLDSKPGEAFGFQLRIDSQQAARQGMLDLLRDGFNNNWTVNLVYDAQPGDANHQLLRVWLTKP